MNSHCEELLRHRIRLSVEFQVRAGNEADRCRQKKFSLYEGNAAQSNAKPWSCQRNISHAKAQSRKEKY